MNRTAYVTGQISGIPADQIKNRFNTVANQLYIHGYRVEGPVAVSDNAAKGESAIRNDIKRMLECDEVHMLPDWQDCKGAQLERDIAIRLGMVVVYHY